jgi:hypothetical protein
VAALGVGLLEIVNDTPDDPPPAGQVFHTVTEAVPAVVRSLAGIVAVNCVELT